MTYMCVRDFTLGRCIAKDQRKCRGNYEVVWMNGSKEKLQVVIREAKKTDCSSNVFTGCAPLINTNYNVNRETGSSYDRKDDWIYVSLC
jgi:hypothetical protein